jgi:hypothetical protein
MRQQLSHHCKKRIDRDSEFEIPGDCDIFASDTYIINKDRLSEYIKYHNIL